jgi:hypothetical protein
LSTGNQPEPSSSTREGKPPASSDSSKTVTSLPLFASIVAVALLLTYLVLLVLQWGHVNAAELTYARRAHLLGGLEALAFAAAGAILGTTVQRQVTKKAEGEASAARAEAKAQRARADAEQNDAEKGRALHNLAKAKIETATHVRTRSEAEQQLTTGPDEFLRLAAQYDARGPTTSET